MQDWLIARANISPHKPALHHDIDEGGQTYTFAELNQAVQVEANRLYNLGIRQAHHIAIATYNHAEDVIGILALMRLGCVVVPINTRLTNQEIAFQCQQADASTLLCYHVDEVHRYQNVTHCRLITRDAITQKSSEIPSAVNIDLEKPCFIIHTSGTSGKPKGALLTYGAIYHSAMVSAYRNGTLPNDRWMCILPLYHVGGLSILLRSILYGTAIDLLSRFDDARINHYLTNHPVTLVSFVPTMLYRLLKNQVHPWQNSLRLILLGGASPSPDLIRDCIEKRLRVATTYGLTEASSQVATATPDAIVNKPHSVGKPLLFTQIRIIDEEGSELPPNQLGEIIVQSPTVMLGYYRNLEATAQALHNGWLQTGDMGYIDDDGDITIVQRRSDLIVTGGENVYPAEVENVLNQHPAIEASCVVGLPDVEWGQMVAVAIVLRDGEHTTSDDILTYARKHLAGYKVPRKLITVHDFPRTASGKIIRSLVQDYFS